MIPVLYDKTGVNKIGDLIDSIECYVEEERNGIFELTMVYPANTTLLDNLCYENIIVVDANDYLKNQKFRIYNTRKLMSNRIEICARHISFDLAHDWIDALSINNQSCEYALNMIFKNSQFSSHFKGHSDIINAQDYAINETTCLNAIGGSEGSILDTFGTGAEILRDNTDIHVLNRRGSDNDVSIEYRKNLTGLEVEEDTTDLVTRILPYATYTNDESEEIKVKGAFVDSPLINNYAHPYVKYIDYSEKFDEDNLPTVSKLETLANKEYINNKVDIPKLNYKIEFIPLSKCAGYEGLEDRINLCDTVTIRDTRYGIDTEAKVIKVTYDVLRNRYESMELGEPKTTLGDVIGGTGESTQGPPGPQGPQGPAGADGSIGDFPSTLPEVPEITTKVYGFANVELSWVFENKVYYSYELYASKTKGFTPNTFNLIFTGQASTFLHQVNPNETWYYRACALNTHGLRTGFSDEVSASTVKITDLSNYVESAAINDALIGELNLGRGWVGELKGNYIDAKQLSVTDGNGKRTLDIDSFGNVSLDVASLKINSNSVATTNDVNNSLKNYSTTTQMNSAINQSATSITNTVSQNYYNKAEIENKGFQTASQVQQTVDNLQVKFAQSGGYNMLYNAGFENGITYWNINGSPTIKENQIDQNYNGKSLFISASAKDKGIYQSFSCVSGKTYSYSFYAQAENCQWRAGIEGIKASTISASPNNWTYYEGTFKATSNVHVFIAYSNGSGNLYIDNVMVCEGALPSVYTPHPSEIYDGITTINKDGIIVEHSNSSLATKYTSNGMMVVDKKNNYDLLTADSDGIGVRGGRFVVTDPNNGHTRLWGRDIIINDQRALVGTNSTPESSLTANKLYVNYSGDFKNGVEISGSVTNNNLPIVTLAGIQSATTGYASINNGFILQWGRITGLALSGGSCKTTITFPITFTAVCATCNVNVASVDGAQDLATNYAASVKVNSNSNATLVLRDVTGKNYGSKIDITFFAIGV